MVPPSSGSDWRMQLNNFLQVNGGTARLQYVDVVSGPTQEPIWHSTAYSRLGLMFPRVAYAYIYPY